MAVACAVLFYLRYVLEDQNTTHIRYFPRSRARLADDDIIEQLLVETSPQKIIDLFSQYAQSDVC